MHIAPLDDATKKRLIKAVAARGQASGLEAAVKVLEALSDHKRRVVGTTEIRDAADVLREKAREIRSAADAEIAAMEAASRT